MERTCQPRLGAGNLISSPTDTDPITLESQFSSAMGFFFLALNFLAWRLQGYPFHRSRVTL